MRLEPPHFRTIESGVYKCGERRRIDISRAYLGIDARMPWDQLFLDILRIGSRDGHPDTVDRTNGNRVIHFYGALCDGWIF